MSLCPKCGSKGAYLGLVTVECLNPDCKHYKPEPCEKLTSINSEEEVFSKGYVNVAMETAVCDDFYEYYTRLINSGNAPVLKAGDPVYIDNTGKIDLDKYKANSLAGGKRLPDVHFYRTDVDLADPNRKSEICAVAPLQHFTSPKIEINRNDDNQTIELKFSYEFTSMSVTVPLMDFLIALGEKKK